MVFYENRLPLYDSGVISYFNYFRELEKMSLIVPSTAAVIRALRVNTVVPFRSDTMFCLRNLIIDSFLNSCLCSFPLSNFKLSYRWNII